MNVNAPPVDLADSYRQLRALRVVTGQGWANYSGAEAHWGRHVLAPGYKTPAAGRRVLLRGEPYWWALGLADGWGLGHLIAGLAAEALPQLLSLPAAAAELTRRTGTPVTPAMVDYRVRVGQLYPIYGARLVRSVFGLQVAALAAQRLADTPQATTALRAAERAASRRWQALAQRLPPQQPPLMLDPPPPPGRLPIMVGKPEATRRQQALIIADAAGWLRFIHPDGDGFLVHVSDARRGKDGDFTVARQLPPHAVLAYVLGHADRRDQAARVAYRGGLTQPTGWLT